MKKGDLVLVKFQNRDNIVNRVEGYFQWLEEPLPGESFQRVTVRLLRDNSFLDFLHPDFVSLPLTKQNKRVLKSAYKQVMETNEDAETTLEYLNAIRHANGIKLAFFQSFGSYARQQIMNVHEYRLGLRFGFSEVKFDEHGWLDNRSWTIEETVEFRVKKDKACCNFVTIAQGPNGCWAWGYSANHGSGSGGGFAPSVFDGCFPDRESCLTSAVNHLKLNLERTIVHAKSYPSPINFNTSYMSGVLEKIQFFTGRLGPTPASQLSLFS